MNYSLDADFVQWESISYCLSQLAFTEKGTKKLMDSFKSYEHVLSEESLMKNFRSIITKVPAFSGFSPSFLVNIPPPPGVTNRAKKFAKPDLKSSLEEFGEKLNNFHIEKKDQDITARNAQDHQQRIVRLEVLVVAKEEKAEADVSEATSRLRTKKTKNKDRK
ncbi:LOW QUALITY PROTEIN: hypothetical protein RJ641_026287, partial [Dillenia turbinata]